MSVPDVAQEMPRGRPIDGHAADRIGGFDETLRLLHEFLAARRAAEMEQPASMLGGRLAGVRIDRHAADRIADDTFDNGDAARHCVVAVGMIVMMLV